MTSSHNHETSRTDVSFSSREVSSLSDVNLNSWAHTRTRLIPEIRHNIHLIAQTCKPDLDNLALEAKALHIHKSFVVSEEARLSRKTEEEAALIYRLQQIQIMANDVSALSKEQASVYEVSLEPFSPFLCKLVDQFPMGLEKYGLDEVDEEWIFRHHRKSTFLQIPFVSC